MLIAGPTASTEPGADEDEAPDDPATTLVPGPPKVAKADTSAIVHL